MSVVLYRRASTVGPDIFIIIHKEGDRELVVGHINKAHLSQLSSKLAWEWNIEFHQREGRSYPQWGEADTVEDAMAALKVCWESADVPIKWPPAQRDA